MFKAHLEKGVVKGALTPDQAEAKFQTWLNEKEAKIDAKRKSLEEGKRGNLRKQLEAEAKVKEARAAELAKKRAAELKAERKEAEEEAAAAEIAPAEETPSTEETPATEE
jgi:small subunit ribosomal protein S16